MNTVILDAGAIINSKQDIILFNKIFIGERTEMGRISKLVIVKQRATQLNLTMHIYYVHKHAI